MVEETTGSARHEPWAIRLAGDEAARKAGDNLRAWAGDERGSVRRFLDRFTAREERDPKLAGAWGEEVVGKALAKLGDDWTVLHGVRVGPKADVDHLVVGPPGVFCLNTKRIAFDSDVTISARQFRVNGYSRDYYPKAVKEAERVADRLSRATGAPVAVRPVIVLVGVDRRRVRVREQPADVAVVGRRDLCRWLTSQPPVLTADAAARLGRTARQPSTWDPAKVSAVVDRVPPAPAVTLSRWRRYGHDRLYVTDAETGQRLGWRDERTGQVHIEDGVDARRVHDAFAGNDPGG